MFCISIDRVRFICGGIITTALLILVGNIFLSNDVKAFEQKNVIVSVRDIVESIEKATGYSIAIAGAAEIQHGIKWAGGADVNEALKHLIDQLPSKNQILIINSEAKQAKLIFLQPSTFDVVLKQRNIVTEAEQGGEGVYDQGIEEAKEKYRAFRSASDGGEVDVLPKELLPMGSSAGGLDKAKISYGAWKSKSIYEPFSGFEGGEKVDIERAIRHYKSIKLRSDSVGDVSPLPSR